MAKLELYDNSRLKDFKRCPRFFFYRHVLHWQRRGISLPLLFGSSWHSAMDVIWGMLCGGGADDDVVDIAFDAFIKEWHERGGPDWEDLTAKEIAEMKGRDPMNAREILADYVFKRAKILAKLKLVSIERPFAVPVYDDDHLTYYVGRIDKEAQRRNTRVVVEHKTTGLGGEKGFRKSYMAQWNPNSQIAGYTYYELMQDGTIDVTAWVDAVLAHRSSRHTEFIPVKLGAPHINAWLWDTRYYIESIRGNMVAWEHECQRDKKSEFLPAFPKNTEACVQYGRPCPYLELCRSGVNPAKRQGPPNGYEENRWEPFDEKDLEKTGLKEREGTPSYNGGKR